MSGYPARFLIRMLAMTALCLQLTLPGAVSLAKANGVDVSQFLCVSPGTQPSARIQEGITRLADLTRTDETRDPSSFSGHCPLCGPSHCALLPEPESLAEPMVFGLRQAFPRYEPGFVHPAQGPPIGARGPPNLI